MMFRYPPAAVNPEIRRLRHMRWVSLLEGATLVALVFVAAPLKHLGGYPLAVTWMGSIHALAFLFYVWMLIQTISGGDWTRAGIVRAGVAAIVPLGGLVNERWLRRKQAVLSLAD